MRKKKGSTDVPVKQEYSPLLPKRGPVIGEEGHAWIGYEEFWRPFPRIYALFAESVGDRTEGRAPATLLVFPDNGALKACWSDKYSGHCLFQTLDLSLPFWEQLEAYLAAHHDDWKPKRKYTPR